VAPHGPWTEKQIVAALRRDARRRGRPPRRTDWERAGERHPSSSSVYRIFGPWSNAIAAAGLEPEGADSWWTRDRIVRALQSDAQRRGRAPTAKEWAAPVARRGAWKGMPRWRAPHPGTVAAVFGSWSAGLRAAGLEARPAHRPRAA
jgi:hypothetical protein